MANSMQAKKRVRQTARQTAVNRNRLSRVRGYVRKVEQAIDAGDKDAANLALREAQPDVVWCAAWRTGSCDQNASDLRARRVFSWPDLVCFYTLKASCFGKAGRSDFVPLYPWQCMVYGHQQVAGPTSRRMFRRGKDR